MILFLFDEIAPEKFSSLSITYNVFNHMYSVHCLIMFVCMCFINIGAIGVWLYVLCTCMCNRNSAVCVIKTARSLTK